jgi:hypothetical protein
MSKDEINKQPKSIQYSVCILMKMGVKNCIYKNTKKNEIEQDKYNLK